MICIVIIWILQDFYAIYIYNGKHTLTNNSGRDCKKKKKETIRNIGLNMGRGKLGQLVLAKTCEAKDYRTQIAEANDAV